MRSTKDQLVEKDVLMPVKHNVFLWNLPDVEEVPSHDGETVQFSSGLHGNTSCGQRTVRMAVYGMQPKARQFLRAGACSKSKPETKTSWTLEQKREKQRRRTREVREQALPSEYHRQTYL
ncbi:hypothetical protein TNCV_4823311 [Trichonephila clavipes]|nr:hypothetical protein TNCV_4823311 [Trichonephila clavipes]